MGSRPDPLDEEHRLAALRRYHVLDTPPEPAFDDLALLALQVCNAPIAVISFVDEHRQWFKARIGLSVVELPRGVSFSTYAIAQRDLFMVPDAAADPRFAANPLVAGESQIRFYAGAPLFTPEGHALGTISVMDRVPRELDRSQQDAMQALARQVTAQLELRRRMQGEVETATSRLAAIVESSAAAIIGKDLDGIVTNWNRGAETLFGYTAAEMTGVSISQLVPAELRGEEERILAEIRRGEIVAEFETVRLTKDGRRIDVSVTASPIKDETGQVIGASKLVRDISDYKRADEELRFRQTMLTAERELTLDGILVVDASSRVLSFNGRFGQMWGIATEILATKSDELLLQSVREKLTHPDEFMARVRELQDRHDEVSRDEVELIDGRVFDRYSAPMLSTDGHYYGRLWYFRDVTERKRAERAVRDERDRAQRYLDAAEVILLALDTNGLITLINRKGCDVLGWSESELIGREWVSTCLPERMREKLTQKFHSLVEGDLSIVENPILTKGGEERLVEWRNRVLRDENGCAIGTLSSGTDITDRARAVDALRTAEERMRFALQYADIGIWDMDCTTGLLQWSEALEAHHGIAPGAFEGTFEAFVKRIDPRDRDASVATIKEGMKSGADFTMENRTVWPDGTQRWLTGAGRFILDPQGKPLRGLGISLDVTDRRKLEDQYHQAQKVDAIGRLTGGVAHDFNNVLSVVLAHACFLLEDLSEVDPRRTDAMEIKTAAERAAGLTKQLLAFSRKQVLAPRALDLNASIAVMEKMLRRLIGEDIVLVIEPSPNLGIVKADGGQIEQVLMNLAVNARDAMPKGGTLTLRTANVQIDEEYRATHVPMTLGEYVMFSVSDSGVGMSAEVQQHMFDPFFTTKEIGKGTGLGLSTCYGIVKQSGGHICASSELGLGTMFEVYLPRIDEVPQAQPARSNAPDLRGAETVLLVDDDEKVRAAALSILERKGYRVLEANGADQALAKAKNHTGVIDLVLSDVVMPRGSGPDLAERLRAARPEIAVLLMSGFTEHAVVERAFAEGANYVQKPFTPETLAGRVREVLDRRNPQ